MFDESQIFKHLHKRNMELVRAIHFSGVKPFIDRNAVSEWSKIHMLPFYDAAERFNPMDKPRKLPSPSQS
jgi:hypothetical protein